MNSLTEVENIVFNNKEKFREIEYMKLMSKLMSLYKMLETKVCSKDCKSDEEEIECPFCSETWYKSDYEY